ncbi:MAG: O-antigen ligase family protein [Bacteriovoracia bacterium]
MIGQLEKMTKTEKILKILIYVGVFALLVIPFIVSNNLYQPFITGKSFVFRVVVEILIAIWLILAILYPKYRPKKNWILFSFVLFVVSLSISNLFGIDQTASFWSNFERMEGWVTIVHLLGLFMVLGSVLNTKKEWYILFQISLAGSLAMLVLAFKEISEFAVGNFGVNPWNLRVDTTIGNSTFLAVYALFNSFLALLLIFKDTNRLSNFIKPAKKTCLANWQMWFYVVAFIANIWMLFQTGTRGAMLGLIGGIVLIGLLMAFLEKEKAVYKKIAIAVIAVVVLLIGIVFSLRDTDFVQSNIALSRIASLSVIEGTSQARINNWKMASEGFKDRPILGWGQGNFNYVFDKHYLPEHHGNETWFDSAHNILFDWLIAGGIFGLFFYLSIWFSTILSIFKSSKFKNIEKAVLVGMLGGYFTHLLFVFDTLVSYLYFIFIIAFVYAITTKGKQLPQYRIRNNLKNILIIAIILITPFTIYLINYQPYKAAGELVEAVSVAGRTSDGQLFFYHENPIEDNIEYFQSVIDRDTFGTGEARIKMMASGNTISNLEFPDQESQKKFNSIKVQYYEFVYDQVMQQIERTPNNSRYPFMLSDFLAQIGEFELAEKYALMAIELSPTKQAIRIPLIRIYFTTDQSEKALALARETYELDKSKRDLWIEYTRVADKFNEELFNRLIDQSIERGKEDWVNFYKDKYK